MKNVRTTISFLILSGALLLTASGCKELAALSGGPDANGVQETGPVQIYKLLTARGVVVQ